LELTPAALATALGLPPPTEEQAAVIAAPARPALVVAGAGAGKTETMAARVVWLVATGQVLPEQVLGLTFTRKAAQQLGSRVRSRLRRLAASRLLDELDPSGQRRAAVVAGEPTVSTYHAYAGRLVGEHALRLPAEPAARLLGETASWQLAHRVVTSWAADLDVDVMPPTVTGWLLALAGELGEHLVDPAAVLAHAERTMAVLSAAPPGKRQRAEPSLTYKRWIDAQRMRRELLPLVEAFTARKRAERAVDFADQLAIAARVASDHPEVGEVERTTFRAVLLDEYQDTGHSQRVLLRALFGTVPGADVRPEGPAVTAVGDPCQSIYGWRGASAGNLVRFRADFPGPDGPADQYGLLTSFRNPPQVLELANAVSAPLREAPGAVGVGALRAGPGTSAGDVRVALLADIATEIDWMADAIAQRWEEAGESPPTSAVLVRRRVDMDAIATALRARGLPVEVVGLGGLLDTPEVRDLVSALRLVADPLSGSAAVRLLTGARWRLGVSDLAALWQRAREVVPGHPVRPGPLTPAELALGALPGEHAEQAGLVDALDDPGPAERYSPLGYARIRRLARELGWLRSRASAPLTDLVADAERILLLDAETAARPGPVGRAHLDAFADVVADFATGAEVATLPALLDYLETAERAEDGLSPGEVEVSTDRVQVLTVHAAKGLEWQVVAVPHVVAQVFPGRKIGGTWLTSPAELPAPLRGDAVDLPGIDLPDDADRKQLEEIVKEHSVALDARRLVEERRLFYVALTRAERLLLVSGHRWGAAGDKPRMPSEFLEEVAAVHPTEVWADEPAEDEVNPATLDQPTAVWPVDPLGDRSADVHEGAELVRAALRGRREARAAAAEAGAPGAQLDLLGFASGDVAGPAEPMADGSSAGPAEEAPQDLPSPPAPASATGGPSRPGADAAMQPSPTPTSPVEGDYGAPTAQLGPSAIAPSPPVDDEGPGDWPLDPVEDEPAEEIDEGDPEGWAEDVDVLLAERAAARARPTVVLPSQLSVSQLVDLAADPAALASVLRRPLPMPPSPHARRGTAFHAWLEQRFGVVGLLDIDDLPGAADEGAASDDALEELQEAYLASAWAARHPIEVEVPFETVLSGVGVRGRMDAVFRDEDGGFTVVDWKTGALPTDERLPALAVQLAVYRLAWASMAGCELDRVRAAFHYVRQDVTIRPVDLLDADGLRALLTSVPAAG
jgi:DNA helicase-2/ATP-dependent DNA helicase PcrA